MKLPKLTAQNSLHSIFNDFRQDNRQLESDATQKDNSNSLVPILVPMGVDFSPNWTHYSWSRSGHTSVQNEQQLVLEMIRNSDSRLVQDYAASNECAVYVRTGLHTSVSDTAEHVQVQLGINAPPYSNASCRPYTCHIRYDANRNRGYDTQCWPGIH